MQQPSLRVVTTFLLALVVAGLCAAQPSFQEVSPPTNPYFSTPDTEDFWLSAAAPADVDGDGDLDLALLGFYVVYNQSVEHRLVILRNDGEGTGGAWSFTPVDVPLGSLFAGSSDLAWGDFDNDGDHDLAVGSEGETAIFRNDAGTLSRMPLSLPGYLEDSSYTGAYDLRSLTWADFDNDGDLDLLVPSVWDQSTFTVRTALMRNDGPDGSGAWLFSEVASGLDPTVHAQSAWADDDGDGDLDLLLVNVDPNTESGFVRRYDNAAGAFTGQDLLPIKVEYGLADWADYDADGDQDVLVAGNIQEQDGSFATVLRVYRHDGAGFTAIDLVDLGSTPWLDIHAATWADYDSDGDIDVLVTGSYVGQGEIVGRSEIWGNQGGTFASLGVSLPAPVSSVGRGGAFGWFDLDGDGDLDYLVAGAYFVPGGNGLVEAQAHLYRNQPAATNAPPAAPSGLSVTQGAGGLVFSWLPVSDDHTPASAITYDLEVRPVSTPAQAAERLPQPGTISGAVSWTLDSLPPGTYRWSVCAVDSAYAGSARSTGLVTVPLGVPLFADGFESGDTSAWSLAVP